MTTRTDNASAPPTVGFDLDLTLVDTRPGIKAAWEAFSAEYGVPVDADLVVSRLGPPLEHEMAYWVPEEQVTDMVARYRALYPAYAIEPSAPMPGARDAIRAVREAGGRTIVVTAKNGPHAELHLAHLGIEPDALMRRPVGRGQGRGPARPRRPGVRRRPRRRRPRRRHGRAPSRWPSPPAPAPPRNSRRRAPTSSSPT